MTKLTQKQKQVLKRIRSSAGQRWSRWQPSFVLDSTSGTKRVMDSLVKRGFLTEHGGIYSVATPATFDTIKALMRAGHVRLDQGPDGMYLEVVGTAADGTQVHLGSMYDRPAIDTLLRYITTHPTPDTW